MELQIKDLKKYRKMFFTIRGIATKTGLSTTTIQYIENPDKKVSIKSLFAYFIEIQECLVANNMVEKEGKGSAKLLIPKEDIDELKSILNNTVEFDSDVDENSNL